MKKSEGWTISDYANLGRSWWRGYTFREAYKAASIRSNGSMKIRIDRQSKVICFRGDTYL